MYRFISFFFNEFDFFFFVILLSFCFCSIYFWLCFLFVAPFYLIGFLIVSVIGLICSAIGICGYLEDRGESFGN